jgi:hypothetical protein
MSKFKRAAAAVAVAGATLGGVAIAEPAEAVEPIPGIPGCYMFSWYDYMYLFHGVAGYCLSSATGSYLMYFDANGNYW